VAAKVSWDSYGVHSRTSCSYQTTPELPLDVKHPLLIPKTLTAQPSAGLFCFHA